MSFNKKTIRDYDIHGKTVLMRADYNVPITSELTIADDYRIKKSLPTIQYLLEQNCKVIIMSHLGRPDGKRSSKDSLRPVAHRLSELLHKGLKFVEDCVGDVVKEAVAATPQGGIVLLENVRFHAEEEANDEDFARRLVEDTGAEIFVQDCFGVAHRAHASIVGPAKHLPALAGLLLEAEVDILTRVIEDPARPLMAIVGGAKISDKIEVLRRFIEIADIVVVGGAMSNTFLRAKDIEVGSSLAEEDAVNTAKDILARAEELNRERGFVFYMPQDGVVATKMEKDAHTRIVDWSAHIISDIENYPKRVPKHDSLVAEDEMILDVGPFSGAFITGAMQLAKTVIWNGALGVTEVPSLQGPVGPFAHGTELVLEGLTGHFGNKPFSVLGGGDTVAFVEERKMTDLFDHVSTGGGASLELLSGKSLPGVDVLWNRD